MLEYTEAGLRDTLLADLSALHPLPVLSMPEVGDDRHPQVAHLGTTLAVRQVNREYRYKFVPDPRFAAIPLSLVESVASELGIGDWELRRTHWAVKDENLFEALYAAQAGASAEATNSNGSAAVRFPTAEARDSTLVAVMMPFAPVFDVVYETITAAATDVGLRCVRVDDIWERDHIMSDVSSLLWRSRVVVADLTGRNTNVFYETGLAHALPRPTILLTQNTDDVPFDLQSIRYLHYGLGTDDRAKLRERLTKRLRTLLDH